MKLVTLILFFTFPSIFFAQERIVDRTYPNGQIDYEGSFKDGVEHGKWVYYYSDGTKKFEEYYKNGFEEGKHYEWAPDGRLVKTEIYKQGKLIQTIEE
jgi:uncharacterized protein